MTRQSHTHYRHHHYRGFQGNRNSLVYRHWDRSHRQTWTASRRNDHCTSGDGSWFSVSAAFACAQKTVFARVDATREDVSRVVPEADRCVDEILGDVRRVEGDDLAAGCREDTTCGSVDGRRRVTLSGEPLSSNAIYQ